MLFVSALRYKNVKKKKQANCVNISDLSVASQVPVSVVRMVDSIYRTRSLGVAAVGLPDQYADGKAAKVWQLYIGDTKSRTEEYRSWVVSLLKQQGCKTVLDVACGTG